MIWGTKINLLQDGTDEKRIPQKYWGVHVCISRRMHKKDTDVPTLLREILFFW